MKTIADLQIKATFIKDNIYPSEFLRKFREENKEICDLIVIPDEYYFLYLNNGKREKFRCDSFDHETLAEYLTHINFAFWCHFQKSIVLDRFEIYFGYKNKMVFKIIEK